MILKKIFSKFGLLIIAILLMVSSIVATVGFVQQASNTDSIRCKQDTKFWRTINDFIDLQEPYTATNPELKIYIEKERKILGEKPKC